MESRLRSCVIDAKEAPPAHRAAFLYHLNGGNWRLAAEVVEIEGGTRTDCFKLSEAPRLCRQVSLARRTR
jgi:hypothetical protein